jgi:hypothetical protein
MQESMKKWLIPLGALVIIAALVVVTWKLVDDRQEPGYYNLYFVAVGDNGDTGKKIGCGDSLVTTKRQTVSDTQISDVYQDLLDIHDYDFTPEMKNALWQSQLSLESADVTAGTAFVTLKGTITMSDKKCDAPRIKAQLEELAQQFDGVKSVEVTVNGQPLDTVLSQ